MARPADERDHPHAADSPAYGEGGHCRPRGNRQIAAQAGAERMANTAEVAPPDLGPALVLTVERPGVLPTPHLRRGEAQKELGKYSC